MVHLSVSLNVRNGRLVSTPDFGPQGPRFESHLKQNSVPDYNPLHCAERFSITSSLSWTLDMTLNNVERNLKCQVLNIFLCGSSNRCKRNEPEHDKSYNKCDQQRLISLYIHPVWQEFSFIPLWIACRL